MKVGDPRPPVRARALVDEVAAAEARSTTGGTRGATATVVQDTFAPGGAAFVAPAPEVSEAPPKRALHVDVPAIFDEMKRADFAGLGLDPVRYVEDRFDARRFLDVLRADPQRTVTLHAGTARVAELPGFVVGPGCKVTHDDPKDFPARVYRDPAGDFHLVGLVGETWTKQAVYMLAAAGIEPAQVKLEGELDGAKRAADELDPTLKKHQFATVTLGPVSAMVAAVDRALRAACLPAHQRRVVKAMDDFLADRAENARDDKRPRWAARRDRLRELAREHPHAPALLEEVAGDPVLRGPLSAFLARAEDGPPDEDLPRKLSWSGRVFRHAVLEIGDQKHLLLSVAHAHGDLAEDAVERVLAHQKQLEGVGFYGTCGSFDEGLGPDTLVLPRGMNNALRMEGARETQHAGVDTLLQEHRAGIDALLRTGAETVDIEVHHVARALEGSGVELRAALRVSDVATSSALGAHRDDRAGTSDYEGRERMEDRIARALGLIAEGAP